tara:strand:- start:391 stop:588 length:198 start_codon:yes stop_codon:yes gene_type:complete
MPTRRKQRSTGVVCVTPAIGRKPGRKWEGSQPYRDLDTRNTRSVSCVDLGHKNNPNWMCSLWMEV